MPVDNALTQKRSWQKGDWPAAPTRGVDGGMYGPGYAADPTGGTDSSPVQKQFGSGWLDNVTKLADNGMLHPKVMEMLRPQIEAMIRSQRGRGQDFDAEERGDPRMQPPADDGGEAMMDDPMRPQRRRY